MLVILLAFPLLRERLTIKKLCSIFISFLGIVVIVTHGRIFTLSLTSLQGDLLALRGASVFALFSVLGKKYRYDQVVSVFLYFVTALVFIIPTLILFSSLKITSLHVWLWLFLNGFVVNGVSYIFMRMRDELGTIYQDEAFAHLFSHTGQPAEAPWRLALVTVMQFAQGLSDRQAADAVRERIDFKYVLGLERDLPGL